MICEDFYKSIGLSRPQPLDKSDRIKFNRFVFQNYFLPKMEKCKEMGHYIQLSESDLKFLKSFCDKKVKAKNQEWKSFDNKNRAKREMTGAGIEYAVLKYFNKENEFDDSIVSDSNKRNHPDLLPVGILCDVKGSSMNNVPLVFKRRRTYTCNIGNYMGHRYRCANVIGVFNQDFVWLLGIASPRILEECVDDNLIMMTNNTSKTGFYGIDQLEEIPSNWNDFKIKCSEKSLVL